MPDYLKLPGGLFFILFAFVFSTHAQNLDDSIWQESSEKPPTNFELSFEQNLERKSNLFSKSYFATESRSPIAPKTDAAPEAENWKLQRGAKHLNVEFGYSPITPTFFSGRKEYDTSGRKFGMINLRWGRVVGTPKNVTYEYQIGITPIALAFKNEVRNPAFQSAQITPAATPTIRQTTYGFAFSPVGFRFLFKPKKRLKPFIAAHAGFIFFKKPVPVTQSTSYDFTGDFGGGLQYQMRENKAFSFGYKYYHISNMNIGAINPGYNANVFYVGYSFFYK